MHSFLRAWSRLLLAAAPLLLTFLFAWLVAESHLNFGSGDKDLLLVLPLALWSLVYLICNLALWWRGGSRGRSVIAASAVASCVLVVAWLILLVAL